LTLHLDGLTNLTRIKLTINITFLLVRSALQITMIVQIDHISFMMDNKKVKY